MNEQRQPVEMYTIRVKYEWAHIFIDETTGTFSAVSTFGNFGHIWHSRGDTSLKEFLYGLDRQYFFEKTHHAHGRTFDSAATKRNIQRIVCENRREGELTKEDARNYFDLAHGMEPCMGRDAFIADIHYGELGNLFNTGDYADIVRTQPDSQCVGFWEMIWPVFLDRIKHHVRRPEGVS